MVTRLFLISKIKKTYQNENLNEIPILKQPKMINSFFHSFKSLVTFGNYLIFIVIIQVPPQLPGDPRAEMESH